MRYSWNSLVKNFCPLLISIAAIVTLASFNTAAQTQTPPVIVMGAPQDDPKSLKLVGPQSYEAKVVIDALNNNQSVILEDTSITGDLENLMYYGGRHHVGMLKARNTTFNGQVSLHGYDFEKLSFWRCQFNRDIDLMGVYAQEIFINSCTFSGKVSLGNMGASEFYLGSTKFQGAVDFSGTKLNDFKKVEIYDLNTQEPINIKWDQFGEKWLDTMIEKSRFPYVSQETKKSNAEYIINELKFWKNNFTKLDQKRDVSEVSYQIIELNRQYLTDSMTEWWAALLLGIPK